MSKHTSGKLQSDGDWIGDNAGEAICYVDGKAEDENFANAARLVTCWNEHDGLVRDNARLYESLNSEMRARVEAEKERDELVAALSATQILLGRTPLTKESGGQWIKNVNLLEKYQGPS